MFTLPNVYVSVVQNSRLKAIDVLLFLSQSFCLIQGEHCQMQKSIKLLLLDASS